MNADTFFISSSLYYIFLVVPIVLLIFIMLFFSRGRAKSWKKKTYIISMASVGVALIAGYVIFSGLLKA